MRDKFVGLLDYVERSVLADLQGFGERSTPELMQSAADVLRVAPRH